ncbi:MAG: sigma-70 family RNA polymerase sigma factor [Planctomycetota bacterium]|jgi:RNA polymerase sigma-70 factor (ECF subfamily)
MNSEPDHAERLLQRAAEGDRSGLDELFALHRDRLRRMVDLRMDPAVKARVDASDVLQEASLRAVQRLDEYLADPDMPFFLWLRFLTLQALTDSYRRHLGARQRDARREVRLFRGPWPEASSMALAEHLIGEGTGPSRAAVRAEQRLRLEQALNSMDRIDREVLTLRHFEHLTNAEVAKELGLDKSAASKRYIRALRNVRGVLEGMGDTP